jgi:two-component system response regulator DegU
MTASLVVDISVEEEKKSQEAAKIALLSPREREIVTVLCEGLSNKQIAGRLFISEATVRNHITSILGKLKLSDRFELAIYSYRHGLAKIPR